MENNELIKSIDMLLDIINDIPIYATERPILRFLIRKIKANIVVCKDCSHFMRGDYCNLNNEWDKHNWVPVEPDGYCAWGERIEK